MKAENEGRCNLALVVVSTLPAVLLQHQSIGEDGHLYDARGCDVNYGLGCNKPFNTERNEFVVERDSFSEDRSLGTASSEHVQGVDTPEKRECHRSVSSPVTDTAAVGLCFADHSFITRFHVGFRMLSKISFYRARKPT